MTFNSHAVKAIYFFEMHRFARTLMTGLFVPAITTSLYFVVFGSAIGSRMTEVDGIAYGAFIVPGLIMLSMFTESIANASFGIYMPKFSGTIYELHSAPVSPLENDPGLCRGGGEQVDGSGAGHLRDGASVRAAADRASGRDVRLHAADRGQLCLFGFIMGLWAQSWEQMQIIPMLVVMPMTFLGGAFYSVRMLPEPWQTITLFNPVVYLISGFRWTFFGKGDVSMAISMGFVTGMLAICIAIIAWDVPDGVSA